MLYIISLSKLTGSSWGILGTTNSNAVTMRGYECLLMRYYGILLECYSCMSSYVSLYCTGRSMQESSRAVEIQCSRDIKLMNTYCEILAELDLVLLRQFFTLPLFTFGARDIDKGAASQQ